MSVILADGTYRVRRRTETMDASRYPVPGYPTADDWAGEGWSNQRPDRSYVLRLDPSVGSLAYDDLVITPGGDELLVRTANLNPGDPDVVWDAVRHVAVTAVLRHLAQNPREEQGGEPG